MQYKEVLPDPIFTHHIEAYWFMDIHEHQDVIELLLPTCTFHILFFNQACHIKLKDDAKWQIQKPGVVFLGQRNKCIHIKSSIPLHLYGIRFKPFAFATVFNTPAFQLNDVMVQVADLFSLSSSSTLLIQELKHTACIRERSGILNELMYQLFRYHFSIDERLRAQLNYIMDRKGSVKVHHLLDEFGTSKVTLRKHFINKVGLTPKKVAQIWRMNYFLQMKMEHPEVNYTELCLKAGFYDQAHFIKEFKSIFDFAPSKYFKQDNPLISIAQHNIKKRFTNQYDPMMMWG